MKVPSTVMDFKFFSNFHVWQKNNPHVIHQHHHQYRYTVNVWAGIVHNEIIGPYILEAFPDLLDDVPLDIRRKLRFQHDGTPAHYALNVKSFLDLQIPIR